MQKHGKTVLVAGGGGFIGGHLTKRLLEDGLRVRCIDIRPIDKWEQVFAGVENIVADLRIHQFCQKACAGVSEVYNLAADMGGMGFLERNKARCMVSVLINTNLLRAAREARVERYFFASSACVYSPKNVQGQDVVIFREEHVCPAMPLEGYGWEKFFSERMCQYFHEDYGLKTRVARFNNSKARETLDWAPGIRLREGMEKTYNWIYDEYWEKYLKVGP